MVVSALLSQRGAPYQIIQMMAEARFIPCATRELTDEYTEVLGRKGLNISPGRAKDFLAAFEAITYFADPKKTNFRLNDPGDQMVI